MFQTKVSIAVVLPHSMFKQREYKKMIMQSAMGLSSMDFVADYELSPFLEMVHPIVAPGPVNLVDARGLRCLSLKGLQALHQWGDQRMAGASRSDIWGSRR